LAARGHLLGLAGGALAVLLALSSCVGGAAAAGRSTPQVATVADQRPAGVDDPVVVDTAGAPMRPEWAELVRSVHRALLAGDLDALHRLYAGEDWAGQSALLGDAAVRQGVLAALATSPKNLGEGYVYTGPPASGFVGYQTAFFLDYDPPRVAGPLRWRGIALAGGGSGT
jgi:hypothetical protein